MKIVIVGIIKKTKMMEKKLQIVERNKHESFGITVCLVSLIMVVINESMICF